MKMKAFTFALFLFAIHPLVLQAQLSPGQLSDAHAHLSGLTNCLTCHTWGSKDLSPKCLDCHTPIKTRIENSAGFHGGLEEKNCTTCHSDHKNRAFEMIHWEPSQKEFDHKSTGYEIKGKHLDLNCQECHKSELIVSQDILDYAKDKKDHAVLSSTYLGLGTNCTDCHADVHKNEFKDQVCQDCHNQNDWKTAKKEYDHNSRTKFPLRGAHKKLDCAKCHKESQEAVGKYQVQKYSGLKFDLCTDCHDDQHKGSFGTNCLKCHTEVTFKQEDVSGAFNHQATQYPLISKHISVKCEKCHTDKQRFKLATSFDQCTDCHEDYHKGAFQTQDRDNSCDRCHSVRGFFPALFGVIEHRNTRFPIDGAHLAQPCIFCHRQDDKPVYNWDPLECQSCHTNNHGEQFSRYKKDGNWCENCHKTSEWVDLSFDHNKTSFALTGKHTEVDCAKCHKPVNKIVQYEAIDTNCNACHTDVHSSQFEQRFCSDCHTTQTWQIPRFDHLSLTEFPLDGQHKDLKCGQCHKFESGLNTIRFKPIAHKCQDCHSFGEFER